MKTLSASRIERTSEPFTVGEIAWQDLPLHSPWPEIIALLAPDTTPRPLQIAALRDHDVLGSRRNVILSAPTNSGKTLVGLLGLLRAVHKGQRAVLIEPLRAIAREKAEELEAIAEPLSRLLNRPRPVRVRLTTGDQPLEGETFRSPPPQEGEIVIATPERFDSILRNPNHDVWVRGIGTVCVDEAHLLADPRRGTTLEYLLTTLQCLPSPPRLILLSATLGNAERLQSWLSPCDLVVSNERPSPLICDVLALDKTDAPNDIITFKIHHAMPSDEEARFLVFVFQTRAAETLAHHLSENNITTLPYHARLSPAQRQAARAAFVQGDVSCLVTTSALGLGVNLPATHVFVRDTTLFGGEARKIEVAQLLQMTGRAGRGSRPGQAAVLVRPNDAWNPDELARALFSQTIPEIHSPFLAAYHSTRDKNEPGQALSPFVVALLARRQPIGQTTKELQTFFERSLGGVDLAAQVPDALSWLTDPCRVLAWHDPETTRFFPTTLGVKASRALLPLPIAAGFAQLLRDLLLLNSSDDLLTAWRPLDHLIILSMVTPSIPSIARLRSYSAALVDRTDAWMERRQNDTDGSLLYRRWIAGTAETSRASEILGSLGITTTTPTAHRTGYLAVFRAALLFDRMQGMETDDLERAWGISGWGKRRGEWRDETVWLLSGIIDLLDLRCFYYHLCETCHASRARILRVKGCLHVMRTQAIELRTKLAFCSPLGPTLLSLRQVLGQKAFRRMGIQSLRRLESSGFRTLAQVAALSSDDLAAIGIKKHYAHQIHAYLSRRSQ